MESIREREREEREERETERDDYLRQAKNQLNDKNVYKEGPLEKIEIGQTLVTAH